MKLFPLALQKRNLTFLKGCSRWLDVLICTYLCWGKSDKIYCMCISDCVKCRECRVELFSLVYGVLKFPTALKLVHFTVKLYYFLSLTISEISGFTYVTMYCEAKHKIYRIQIVKKKKILIIPSCKSTVSLSKCRQT